MLVQTKVETKGWFPSPELSVTIRLKCKINAQAEEWPRSQADVVQPRRVPEKQTKDIKGTTDLPPGRRQSDVYKRVVL